MTREQVRNGPTSIQADRAERQLIVERVFDAPRALVWKAWTEPERIARWWGPQGWDTTNYTMDVKPGGVWHYCMRGPDGTESWGKAVYRDIVPPERLVYYDVFSDAAGGTNEEMFGMLITIEFTEIGQKTQVTSITEFASVEQLEAILAMGVVEGVSQTWDRLDEYLREQP